MKYKDLDETVLDGLRFLRRQKLPKVKVGKKDKILVIGSGNAHVAGKLIFKKHNAIFASESDYLDLLRRDKKINLVVIVSASGSKHAPIIINQVVKFKKRIYLLTSNSQSPATEVLKKVKNSKIFVYPKLPEVYTYNYSTYLSMILPHTKDDPDKILHFLKNLNVDFSAFKNQSKFLMVLPNRFAEISRMLNVKFMELFGRTVSRDVETLEYVKLHAATVVPSSELALCFGFKEEFNFKKRIYFPFPGDADVAFFISLAYFVIGKIQKHRKPVFRKNISRYIKELNKEHGLRLQVLG